MYNIISWIYNHSVPTVYQAAEMTINYIPEKSILLKNIVSKSATWKKLDLHIPTADSI